MFLTCKISQPMRTTFKATVRSTENDWILTLKALSVITSSDGYVEYRLDPYLPETTIGSRRIVLGISLTKRVAAPHWLIEARCRNTVTEKDEYLFADVIEIAANAQLPDYTV